MASSLRKLFLHGAFWTSCQFGGTTIVGLLQLVISSRILTPIDFGIWAIVQFFFNLVSVAYSMGFSAAIIQKKGNVDSYLNTVWTAGIAVALIFSLLTSFFIPCICKYYFHNTEASLASIIIMFNCLFITASNPGTIKYLKDVEMKIVFFYNALPKIVGFSLSISFLLAYETYWGLIWGLLAENFIRCVLSYYIHPYRPKLGIDLNKFKELYSFSGWIQLKNIVSWLAGNVDVAVVGNALGPVTLGYYNRAQSMSNYPKLFVNGIVDSVAYPIYAKISEDKDRFEKMMVDIQNVVMLLLSIFAFCFISFDQEIIDLVLGSQWISMHGPFKVICVGILLQTLLFSFNPVLRAMGFAKQEFLFYIFKTSILALLLYPLSIKWNLLGAGIAILLAVLLSFPPYMFVIKRKTGLNLRNFYFSLFVSFFVTAIFIYVYSYIPKTIWWLDMIFAVFLFVIFQTAVSFLLRKGPGLTIIKIWRKEK